MPERRDPVGLDAVRTYVSGAAPVTHLPTPRSAAAIPPPAAAEPSPASSRHTLEATRRPAGGDDAGDPSGGPGGPSGTPKAARGEPELGPIQALGRMGELYYFINPLGGLCVVPIDKMSDNRIMHLYAPRRGEVYARWPRYGKEVDPQTGDRKITGWDTKRAREDLIEACALKGLWDPMRKLRGSGAWMADDGGLVFHCGDQLWMFPADPRGLSYTSNPQALGGYVYPAEPAKPRPADEHDAPAGDGGPAGRLLDALETWRWARPDVDPTLLLGWVGMAFLGAAPDWRPVAVVTGDAGSGKSTLQRLLRPLFGELCLSGENVTAAGLWQYLQHSSMPVMLDEQEAGEDNRQLVKVFELARASASGGRTIRGGADHSGTEFTARSSFLFSMILMPNLPSQDRQRCALLQLHPLAPDAPVPDLAPVTWAAVGRGLMRRLASGWPRWADTLGGYRSALLGAGHTARGADTFGHLLAAADLLLYDDFDRDAAAGWAEKLRAEGLREVEDDRPHPMDCLDHILTAEDPHAGGGRRPTILAIVRRAAGFEAVDGAGGDDTEGALDATLRANKQLRGLGLAVKTGELGVKYLMVANHHRALDRLFDHSKWQGGVWAQSLRAGPLYGASDTYAFEARKQRCTAIDLRHIFGDGDEQGDD